MKKWMMARAAGAALLGLAGSGAAMAGDADTVRARLHTMMSQLEQRGSNSADANERMRRLAAAMMDDSDLSDLEDGTRGDTIRDVEEIVASRSCASGYSINRDRLEPSRPSCGVIRLVRITRDKGGRIVRETLTRNGTNTVYHRTIGKGHTLAVKQRGAGNSVSIVQSD